MQLLTVVLHKFLQNYACLQLGLCQKQQGFVQEIGNKIHHQAVGDAGPGNNNEVI